MKAHLDHLLEGVMTLSREDRSAVAAALIDSLESENASAVSEAWRAELINRRGALRAGTVKSRPWADVKTSLAAL